MKALAYSFSGLRLSLEACSAGNGIMSESNSPSTHSGSPLQDYLPRRPPVMNGLLSDQLIHRTIPNDSMIQLFALLYLYNTYHHIFLYHAHRSISKPSMAGSRQITGGCLCGQVRYIIGFSAGYPWPPAVSFAFCVVNPSTSVTVGNLKKKQSGRGRVYDRRKMKVR